MHFHSFSDPSVLPGTSKTTGKGDTFVSDLKDKAFSLPALNKLYCFHNSILSSWLANELGMYYVGRRQWHPTPVLLPGKSHGRKSLVGYSPWGREESDTTEGLHFHFSLSCIGEGNGSPLQCSCLENPRDGGAWCLPSLGLHRVGHD